ncbi:DUF2334 domain-containing protein [Konateibacter massiliensis]|uniref:DUF2334 domain-containing protein n=1 Tax=Konateibacter massiliensis TaxID=2002841 RepID=UPI000C15DE6A|nr:DUF2334 domain-containing protein [Konateibacter massiliensis]
MMFKKLRRAILCSFFFLFLTVPPFAVKAEETGDILLIYSDGADDETMEQVMSIVEYLTYQRFSVTYAPADDCLNELENYSSIICYKVERYPAELIGELKEREEEGNAVLQAREGIKNSSGENDIRLLFVGNEFLKTYLDKTERADRYEISDRQTGKLQYYFSDMNYKEALVKEENFLFLTGDLDYSAGSIEVEKAEGYFCARVGSLYHLPVTDLGTDLVKAAFIKEAAQWKWPYNGEPQSYAQYIVLDKVYPFQSAEKLLEIVNYLIGREEPFVISVMPVYDHGNYPTMQQFCEVLRYAQANGGTILIHSPINQMPSLDVELVNEYMTSAISIYMEQGVYLMGVEVPRNWMFNEDTIEIMSRFSTVLVSDEEDPLITSTEGMHSNVVYKDGHQWIAPAIQLDNSGVSFLKTNSFAVSFDITDDMELIKEKVSACITSFVPLKSLWDIDHSFWTDEDIMNYKNHIILVNGKRIENDFTATQYDDDFKYNRNTLQRYSKDLTNANKKLIVVVFVVSSLFLLFIFMARRQNKKAFFIKKGKKKDEAPSEEELEKRLKK